MSIKRIVNKILEGEDVRQIIESCCAAENTKVLEGKLVPDENGVIVLGDRARGKGARSIDPSTLTADNVGDEVWVLCFDNKGYYDDNDEWQTENADYIKKGVIYKVSIYKPDVGRSKNRVDVEIKFVDGKSIWIGTDSIFSSFYTPKEAEKLVDASNKRKGIDAAYETISSKGLKDRANLKNSTQTFNSNDYGEGATISIGCSESPYSGGKGVGRHITLYCYVSPKGYGHVNNGSTIEVGYTYVNGKLKRHVGVFNMPFGKGWIDNSDVQTTSLAQFDNDVKLLKDIQANPEKYSTKDIMQKLKNG